jgi:hypothetical protein
MTEGNDRQKRLNELLQQANVLLQRSEARPPFSTHLMDKATEVQVRDAQNEKSRDQSVQHSAEDQLLRDPNVVIGKFTDSEGRNLIEPWAESHSMFAGFRGNFKLLSEAPGLLLDIISLFIPQTEPEPIPEPEPEPEVEPLELDLGFLED